MVTAGLAGDHFASVRLGNRNFLVPRLLDPRASVNTLVRLFIDFPCNNFKGILSFGQIYSKAYDDVYVETGIFLEPNTRRPRAGKIFVVAASAKVRTARFQQPKLAP